MNTIKLSKDWDYQPKLHNKLGHHVIRQNEQKILQEFMIRRKEGALLILGQRGIGKTSAIITAINESLKLDKSIIPIILKAPTITITKDDDGKIILINLIRSLYHNTKNIESKNLSKELKIETKELYKKSRTSENQQITQNENKTTTTKKFKINFAYKNIILSILASVPSLIYYLSSIFFSDYQTFIHDYLSYISIITILSIFIYFAFEYAKNNTNITTQKEILKYDYTFYMLQFDFEELLTKYSNDNKKILFVIDEIDQNTTLLQKFSLLKMLITQNNALFLFVMNPESYYGNTENILGHETLFSQKLFMTRPLFDEVRDFLNEIISEDTNDEVDDFKYYICYKSKMVFYHLYDALRDHMISINDDNSVTLDIKLNERQVTFVNLQKTIEWTYKRHHRINPSEWRKNDNILKNLYEYSEILSEQLLGTSVKMHNKKIVFSNDTIDLEIYDEYVYSALVDFHEILIHQGYLKSITSEIVVIGTLKQFNVDEPMFIEERRSYQKRYEKLLSTHIAIVNLHERVINHNDEIFKINNIDAKWQQFADLSNRITHVNFIKPQLKKLYNNFGNNILENSDHVKKLLSEIVTEYENLLDQFPAILSNIIVKNSSDLLDNGRNILGTKFYIELEIKNYGLRTTSNLFYDDIIIITNPKKSMIEHILDRLPNSSHILIICIHDGGNDDLLRLSDVLDIDTSNLSELINHIIRKPKIILMRPTLTYTTFRKLMDITTLSK